MHLIDNTNAHKSATETDLMSVSEFCHALRIGRTSAYEIFASGEVTPIRIGRRTLIPRSEKDNLIAKRLADARNSQKATR
jgi:excisionase family DNA binding protein